MALLGGRMRVKAARWSAPAFVALASVVCSPGSRPDPELRPDSVLRAELGLGDDDQVHRIELAGADREIITPAEVEIFGGHWVEFVTTDWRVHEVRFDPDSLTGEGLAFLVASDQMESPPLVDRGARFVVSFAGAPEGRYPFVVEGNTPSSRGVVVVLPRR